MFKINITKIIDPAYSWFDSFKAELGSVFSLFYVRVYLVFFVLLNGLNWFFAYYIYSGVLPETRELIALHYNVEFGVNLIGSAKNIYILPALGLLIVFINLSLLLGIYKMKSSRFLGHFILLPALICNVYLFIGLASIYLVNFK